eukprot:1192706-Prorocentrum_minimum.AAC.2
MVFTYTPRRGWPTVATDDSTRSMPCALLGSPYHQLGPLYCPLCCFVHSIVVHSAPLVICCPLYRIICIDPPIDPPSNRPLCPPYQAVAYLTLANQMLREALPQVLTVAEDVSCFAGLCRPIFQICSLIISSLLSFAVFRGPDLSTSPLYSSWLRATRCTFWHDVVVWSVAEDSSEAAVALTIGWAWGRQMSGCA